MLHSFASWSNFLLKRFAVPFFLLYCRCTGDHAVCWKALLPLFSYRCIVHWWPQSLLKWFAFPFFLQRVGTTKFAEKVCFPYFLTTCQLVTTKFAERVCYPLFSYNIVTGDHKVCSFICFPVTTKFTEVVHVCDYQPLICFCFQNNFFCLCLLSFFNLIVTF